MKLAMVSFVKNEEHCIEMMLKSIMPFVDAGYVLIDDLTTDKTEEICRDYGCETRKFTFANFGKLRNISLKWMKEVSDWHILLGGDEMMDVNSGPLLRDKVELAKKDNIECLGILRLNWDNLEMKGSPLSKRITPPRICNSSSYPRIHTEKYYHAAVKGYKSFREEPEIIKHHFRAYWIKKLNKNILEKKELYKNLEKLRCKESGRNIWPD